MAMHRASLRYVIPAEAGIQTPKPILDSGSRYPGL